MKAKRWMLFSLCMVLALCTVWTTSRADGQNCGDDLLWSFDASIGKLTIAGIGAMYAYGGEDPAPWGELRDQITEVVLEDGVTGIGAGAFAGCAELAAITIPLSVESVGANAFEGCTALTVVDYLGTEYDADALVTAIGEGNEPLYNAGWYRSHGDCGQDLTWTFDRGTGRLTIEGSGPMTTVWEDICEVPWALDREQILAVSLPDGLTAVGENAFRLCSSLAAVAIPDTVTSIGDEAFLACESLTELTIGSGVASIGEWAFNGCTSLTELVIPGSVTDMGWEAFCGCASLADLTISDGIPGIGAGAFCDCASLAAVTIPDSVTGIGADAFEGCAGLMAITVPASVTAIGDGAFSGCAALQDVYYQGTAAQMEAMPGRIGMGNGCILDAAWHVCAGVCGDELTWSVDPLTSVLTIAGSGDMYGYIEDDPSPWAEWTGDITDLVLPEGLTCIGSGAFADLTRLAALTIPGSVTEIGADAFRDCTGLTSITIPGSVTEIGEYAFHGCTGLTSVTLSHGVAVIHEGAFEGCSGISSITIPGSVTSIAEMVFNKCTSLTEFLVAQDSETYTAIDGVLFRYDETGLELDRYPLGKPQTSYGIPHGVTGIGRLAFYDCTNLTSITIPDGVTYIFDEAFCGCAGLLEVAIPHSVSSIGEAAFLGCEGLTAVAIPGGVSSIDWQTFGGCTGLTSVILPDSVTGIGYEAFYGCFNLKTVTYLGTKEQLGTLWPKIMEEGNYYLVHAAWQCSDGAYGPLFTLLTSGSCGADLTWSIDMATGVLTITGSGAMDDSDVPSETPWAEMREGIRSVSLPDGLTTIGMAAFGGTDLVTVSVPNGVTAIGEEAFAYSSLVSITLPDSVTHIGEDAFMDCGLTDVYYRGTEEQAAALKAQVGEGNELLLDATWHYGCALSSGVCGESLAWSFDPVTGRLTVTGSGDMYDFDGATPVPWEELKPAITAVALPDGLTSIGSAAFAACPELTSVSIPGGVTVIGEGAFNDCESLSDVTIPDTVTAIEDSAFAFCPALTEIDLPDGVAGIGWQAFAATGLTALTIPDSVVSIDAEAFIDCTGLTSVTIPAGVAYVGSGAFFGCTGLTEFRLVEGSEHYKAEDGVLFTLDGKTLVAYPAGKGQTQYAIPGGVTAIGAEAFNACEILTAIAVPDGVTEIGDRAFCGCTGLVELALPDSVTGIGEGAFSHDEGLTAFVIPDHVTDLEYLTFLSCTSLATVTIPGGVETIGEGVFEACAALTDVYYRGSAAEMAALQASIGEDNGSLADAAWHYSVTATFVSDVDEPESYGQQTVFAGSLLTEPHDPTRDGSDFGGWYMLTPGVWAEDGTGLYVQLQNGDAVYLPTVLNSWADCDTDAYFTAWSFRDDALLADVTLYAKWTERIAPSGACGDDLTWTFHENTGTLAIEGSGAMYDYDYSHAPWASLLDQITGVSLPAGLTSVGNFAFANCAYLAGVSIPDTATGIGHGAFYGCSGLSSLALGGVETIGKAAFCGCTGLTEVTLPDGVATIGENAFDHCTGLASVVMPRSVRTIGRSAFGTCSALTDVYYQGTAWQKAQISIWDDNSDLEDAAWHCWVLSTVEMKTLPANLIYAEGTAPADPDVTGGMLLLHYGNGVDEEVELTVDMVSGFDVTAAGEQTLTVTYEDKTTAFDVTVEHVPGEAVRENVVEATCTEAGSYDEVIRCTVCGEVLNSEGKAIDALGHDIVHHDAQAATCTEVGWKAYDECRREGCGYSTYEEIPALGHTPGDAVQENLAPATYEAAGSYDEVTYCTVCLEELSRETKTIPKLVPANTCGADLTWSFDADTGTLTITGTGAMTSAPWVVYSGRIRNVSLPDGLTAICANAFSYCTGLTSVTIPDGVAIIGENAFDHCTGLASLVMPRSVRTIGRSAFGTCSALTDVYYRGTAWQKAQISIEDDNSDLEDAAWHCWVLSTVEMKTLPATLVYGEGTASADPDVTGGMLLLHFGNGVDEEVELTVDMVSGFDVTAAGKQTLTVTYEDKTTAFDVTVEHVPGEAVRENVVEATCTEAGSYDEVIRCTVCGEVLNSEGKAIDALGHDIVHHDAQAATCTEVGWSAYDECRREGCGYSTYEEIPALGHTPGDAVQENLVPATYEAAGSYDEVTYCTVCLEELSRETKTIDKLVNAVGWQQADGKWLYYDGDGAYLTGWQQVGGRWYYLDPADGHMTNGWQLVDGKWYYLNPGDNGYMVTGWKAIGGRWYYLLPDKGYMANGWQLVDGKWYYLNPGDNGYMVTGWQAVGGRWYYLKPGDGYMATGWQVIDGKTYYLNPGDNGYLVSGWRQIDGRWYYLDPAADSTLATGWKAVGGKWYYLDPADGHMTNGWQLVDGKWYYLNPGDDGFMVTGWKALGGRWYYLLPGAGYMANGWQRIDGRWYYLNPGDNGYMVTGWLKLGSKWYYLKPGDGFMATGWLKLGSKWYYLKPGDGFMATGWTKVGAKWYYLNPGDDGFMITGWKQIGGYWYYLNPGDDGYLVTGWKQVDGYWYYLDPNNDSRMATGWKAINGQWYYFQNNGVMVTGTRTIDGVSYTFNADGVCVNP